MEKKQVELIRKEMEKERVGKLMQNRLTIDKEPYIFLGLVSDPTMEKINTERMLGWFTPYPIRLKRGGFESEVPIFAWFIDLFEDI